MMRYVLLEDLSVENLQKKVNQKMGQGYEPLGRPFATSHNWKFYQAMTMSATKAKARSKQ
jgi:hypothetical protein